jgi:teichuronic acid biosynthesis glycosyltransferase TuaG
MDKVINVPVVSVIMPAYNAAEYIQKAIDSIVAQTFTNWELIIIDDGSTDETGDIIARNVNKDNRIKSFYQINSKQGKARNLGISNSRATYIAFLDSDDIWLSEKLSVQLNEIKNKDVDLVFSDCYVFYEDNDVDRTNKMNTLNMIFKGKEAVELFLQCNRIPMLTVLAKRDKINQVKGFTENKNIPMAEDYHLWLKMLIEKCSFYGSNKILALYRVHDKSSTNQDKLAYQHIPDVFYNLMCKYPQEKHLILKALKIKFRKQYYRQFYSKSDFNSIIVKNCIYIGKKKFTLFFKFFNYCFGKKITIKAINFLLND